MYGTQADSKVLTNLIGFENDVKMYGTQAYVGEVIVLLQFENDVKMYGTQATPQTCTY